MPELPNVEVFRRYIDATCLHQTIEAVTILDADVMEAESSAQLKHTLAGNRFEKTDRRGKYLFIQLNTAGWLIFHFGMTGYPKYYRKKEETPDHPRVRFVFQNGYRLDYDNQRKFGRVDITHDIHRFIAEKNIGTDALAVDLPSFMEMFESKPSMVKSALMNQKTISGVGNVYSDEILFQAGIHPKTKIKILPSKRLQRLYDSMKYALQTSIDCNAEHACFPDDFIIPHRVEGGRCPKCERELVKEKIAGRVGYYCNTCQKS